MSLSKEFIARKFLKLYIYSFVLQTKFSLSTFFFISLILLSLFLVFSFNIFSGIAPLIVNICILNCFSNASPSEEYVKLACSIILLWSDVNMSSSLGYSYLSTLPDDNADIFVASLSLSQWSFSFLILSLIVVINFYILSKRFFLNRKKLSDTRVVSIIKKECGFSVHYL